jgi:hypothetical protein
VVTRAGRFSLAWRADIYALQAVEAKTRSFLLVTDDPQPSYSQMLSLFSQKDPPEKRFEVIKQDLLTHPLLVHSDMYPGHASAQTYRDVSLQSARTSGLTGYIFVRNSKGHVPATLIAGLGWILFTVNEFRVVYNCDGSQ